MRIFWEDCPIGDFNNQVLSSCGIRMNVLYAAMRPAILARAPVIVVGGVGPSSAAGAEQLRTWR